MYSVIIPTLWLPHYFLNTLRVLCDYSLVDEIIIIDNDKTKTPTDNILKHHKIKLLTQESNIYVNPAWNLGVSLCKNEKICILNDDITFDLHIFDYLNEKLNKSIGIIGLDMLGIMNENNDNSPSWEMLVDNCKFENYISLYAIETRIFGFGCIMFFHIGSYYEIPKDLLVFCGDDYLVEMNKKMNKQNYVFTGVRNCQIYGVSSENTFINLPEHHIEDKTKHLKYF